MRSAAGGWDILALAVFSEGPWGNTLPAEGTVVAAVLAHVDAVPADAAPAVSQ